MSMEINGMYRPCPTDYTKDLKTQQEKTKEAQQGQNAKKEPGKTNDMQDEYISSEASGEKPRGLYRLGQDENGRKKVFFDDPQKQPDATSDDPKKAAEKCIGNTDMVDREIKELKEKKKELEQQIRSASGDEKKVRELENKLAQVESELSQKDNDTYRRQHSTFTNLP